MRFSVIGALLLAGSFAYSAIPARPDLVDEVKSHFRLAPEKRALTLRGLGKPGKDALVEIAFNRKEPLDTRWKALVTLGRLDPDFARPHLEKAMKSSEWFMRNAALVVVPYNERDWAVRWSRILMHDPALVVRTAAVKVLTELRAIEATDLLWEKLYASENFKRGQSLWIRPYIVKALSTMPRPQDEKNFLKILSDEDARLHEPARLALQKITGVERSREEWVKLAPLTVSEGASF